jgi:hypothetical protein
MLSFYEMDCLLQKAKKKQNWVNEAGMFDDLNLDFGTGGSSQQPQQPQPQQPQAPKGRRRRAAPKPPAPPAPTAQQPAVGSQFDDLNLDFGTGGGTQQPAPPPPEVKIIQGHDPRERGSEAWQKAWQQYGKDLKEKGREETRAPDLLNNDEPIIRLKDIWNNTLAPKRLLLRKSSDPTKEDKYRVEQSSNIHIYHAALEEAGVDMSHVKYGQPFFICFGKNQDGKPHENNRNGYPEVVVTARQLSLANHFVKKEFGMDTERDDPLSNPELEKFNQAAGPDLKNPQLKHIVGRAGMFFNRIYGKENNGGDFFDKKARVSEYAKVLPRHIPNLRDAAEVTEDATPTAITAIAYLARIVRDKLKYPVWSDSDLNSLNGNSILTFINPKNAGAAQQQPQSAGGKTDTIDPHELIKQWALAQQTRSAQPRTEACQWMDIYGLIEHWGF